MRKGQYECKYEYACEYYKVGTYGWASNVRHIGQWFVLGNYEYFNDGPPQIDLGANSNGGGMLLHFGRNHYGGSVTSIAANQAWSKIYGPFLIYFNSNAAGADACWADAQAQVAAETFRMALSLADDEQQLPASRRPRHRHRQAHRLRRTQARPNWRRSLGRRRRYARRHQLAVLEQRLSILGASGRRAAISPFRMCGPALTRSPPTSPVKWANIPGRT